MSTRLLLIVLVCFSTVVDLGQSYHFVDRDCLSRYNCTLKPRLPCVVTVLAGCPPQARLEHWPSKPTDVRVEEYDSVLRGQRCYGRENITWGIPSDGSATIVKGFMVTVTCLAGHCIGKKECIYFNLSAAVWKLDDIVEKLRYSFDCLLPLRGKQHIDITTLPKAHDGSNNEYLAVTLPKKDCFSLSPKPPTTLSTHRPASSTTSGSITDFSTTLTWGQATLAQTMSTALSQTTGRTGSGVFTLVAVVLGCFCGSLLSILLLFFVYKHYRATRRSHQKSVQNDGNYEIYNSAHDAVAINGQGGVYTMPDSMPTLETILSANTEQFWDEGPFKPPELFDMDAQSTTTSELSRAVRAINEEDAELQRANGFRTDFRHAAVFHSIDESEETCSIAGTSI